MSAKTVEDLFLADDVRRVSPWLAEALEGAESHEECDRLVEDTLRLLEAVNG